MSFEDQMVAAIVAARGDRMKAAPVQKAQPARKAQPDRLLRTVRDIVGPAVPVTLWQSDVYDICRQLVAAEYAEKSAPRNGIEGAVREIFGGAQKAKVETTETVSDFEQIAAALNVSVAKVETVLRAVYGV